MFTIIWETDKRQTFYYIVQKKRGKKIHHKSKKPEIGTSDLFNEHPLAKHEVLISWPHTARAGQKPQKKASRELR